jgi:hypothetical protein
LLDKNLLLLCATAFVTQSAESAITRQKINVPRFKDFAVWMFAVLGWAGRSAIQKIARSKNYSPVPNRIG